MADVTEVIHKISYEVNDEALINATKAIQAQVAELNKLQKSLDSYTQQLGSLSANQSKQLDALLLKIDDVNKRITTLATTTQGMITQSLKGVLEGLDVKTNLQEGISKYVSNVKKQFDELKKAGSDYTKTSIGFHNNVGTSASKNASKSASSLSKLGKSLASTTGLLDIGVSLLVSFVGELQTLGNEIGIVSSKTDALNIINQGAADDIAKVSTELEVMKTRFFDAGTSAEQKKLIVDELNTKYGSAIGYMKNINDAEQFFINKSDDFVKAVTLRAKIEGAYKLIAENESKLLKAQSAKPEDNVSWASKAWIGVSSYFTSGNLTPMMMANYHRGIDEKNQEILKKAEDETTRQQSFLTALLGKFSTELQELSAKNNFNFDGNNNTNGNTGDNTTPDSGGNVGGTKIIYKYISKPDVPQEPVTITANFSPDESQMAADLQSYIDSIVQPLQNELQSDLASLNSRELDALQEVEDRYKADIIKYDEYEQEKTDVARKYAIARLQAEINSIDAIISNYQEGSEEYLRLQKQRQEKTLELSGLNNQVKHDKEKYKDGCDGKKRKDIKKEIQEFQNLASAAVEAYSTISKAQQEALDKEIAYREKRVEAAKKLAERGNADLLKMEEKRLEEAQKKKEEIARRDATVNAALAATNALVAVTGALATAAKNGDGYSVAARVAIALSAILAALGTGYAFVKSLDTSAAFADGVVGYKGQGGPRDDQNIVRISNGESVITAEGTQRNRALLEAINRGESFTMMGSGLPFVMPNFKSPTGASGYASASNMHKVEQKLDRVVMAIEDNRMKQNIFFNEHGVGLMTERAIKKNNRRFK